MNAMNDFKPTVFRLIEYERWCNLRAMDFLDTLATTDLYRDFGFGHRTPHRTMFHIADVMQGWSRSVGPVVEKPSWLAYDSTLSLLDLRTMLTTAGETLLLAAKASEETGVLGEDRRLHHVLHLVTHGTHHRGQLLSMVTLMGHPQPFEGGDFGGWSKAGA
jgi:uncharacterized damage-inducible protein DinB